MAIPNMFNEDLDSLLAKAVGAATKKDGNMAELKQSIVHIKSECPKIQQIIDGKKGVSLSEEECRLLSEYFALDNKMIAFEYRVCYLKGFTAVSYTHLDVYKRQE